MTYNVFGGTLSLTQSINQTTTTTNTTTTPTTVVIVLLDSFILSRRVTFTSITNQDNHIWS